MQTTTTNRSKPQIITVTCELGTFTRKTARTYKYVLLVQSALGNADWQVRNWCGRLDLAWAAYDDFKRNYVANEYYRTNYPANAIAIVNVTTGEVVQKYDTANWFTT